jgi:hypothetical protein
MIRWTSTMPMVTIVSYIPAPILSTEKVPTLALSLLVTALWATTLSGVRIIHTIRIVALLNTPASGKSK